MTGIPNHCVPPGSTPLFLYSIICYYNATPPKLEWWRAIDKAAGVRYNAGIIAEPCEKRFAGIYPLAGREVVNNNSQLKERGLVL